MMVFPVVHALLSIVLFPRSGLQLPMELSVADIAPDLPRTESLALAPVIGVPLPARCPCLAPQGLCLQTSLSQVGPWISLAFSFFFSEFLFSFSGLNSMFSHYNSFPNLKSLAIFSHY